MRSPRTWDASLHAAATREAREESGIPDLVLDPGIAQLSTHDLAAAFGRCRTHYDVRFAGTAPLDGSHAISDESLDVRWWPVDDLPGDATPDMPTLVAAARRHLHLLHPQAPSAALRLLLCPLRLRLPLLSR